MPPVDTTCDKHGLCAPHQYYVRWLQEFARAKVVNLSEISSAATTAVPLPAPQEPPIVGKGAFIAIAASLSSVIIILIIACCYYYRRSRRRRPDNSVQPTTATPQVPTPLRELASEEEDSDATEGAQELVDGRDMRLVAQRVQLVCADTYSEQRKEALLDMIKSGVMLNGRYTVNGLDARASRGTALYRSFQSLSGTLPLALTLCFVCP
jgi:hypothetical protein